MEVATRNRLSLKTRTPKPASNEPLTFGIGHHLGAALPARADLTHKIQSSVQLDVGGASTRAIRVGNSYSISGTRSRTSVTLVAQPQAMPWRAWSGHCWRQRRHHS